MNPEDLLRATALEQARLVREGVVSSEELTRLYLDRIARLNPHLNAFVSVAPAIAAARKKDARRQRAREGAPPFDGVPIGIKDLNVVRWMVTRWGSRAVPHLALPFDDVTVASLRRAGFVMLGKLATSEFGAMPVTEPAIHPPTRNPWSLAHSAGGSSGGCGSAVAAALIPVAQGSDGAGSLRIPAAYCHLFAIKPSRGLIRNQFGLPDGRLLYSSGPMTRSVEDAAALLDVMASPSRPVQRGRELAPESFRARAATPPPRLRIHFTLRSAIAPTDPEISLAVERSLRSLADLGHHVEEDALPDATVEEFLPLWQRQIAQTPLVRWSRTQPVTKWLGTAGRRLREHDVARVHDTLTRRFAEAMRVADVWITPTVAVPPPRIGAFDQLPPERAFAAAAQLGAFTAIANVTGAPAASLPVGLTRAGLPIGMQLIGSPGADAVVLALAHEFEQAQPWRHVLPPEIREVDTANPH